jgi:hypothetical protein
MRATTRAQTLNLFALVDAMDVAGKLTADYAGHYAATMPSSPIPLIHTITAPAAMRLVLAEVPAELGPAGFRTIAAINRELFGRFGGKLAAAGHIPGNPGNRPRVHNPGRRGA